MHNAEFDQSVAHSILEPIMGEINFMFTKLFKILHWNYERQLLKKKSNHMHFETQYILKE